MSNEKTKTITLEVNPLQEILLQQIVEDSRFRLEGNINRSLAKNKAAAAAGWQGQLAAVEGLQEQMPEESRPTKREQQTVPAAPPSNP